VTAELGLRDIFDIINKTRHRGVFGEGKLLSDVTTIEEHL
jgi:hypothetical protein